MGLGLFEGVKMTTFKVFLRDMLGLVLILSAVLALFSLLLDLTALFAYLHHDSGHASLLLHESYYLLVFFIPPYFIGKYINRAEVVQAVEDFLLMKSKQS